jgi:hypothetical protein
MNYFRKEFPVDRVHRTVDHRNPDPRWTGRGRRHWARRSFGLQPLRCPRVPAKGQERESGVRGVRWAAHRGMSVPARERRREERGEVWSAPGVLEVAFIGPRVGAGGVAGLTVAMNGY